MQEALCLGAQLCLAGLRGVLSCLWVILWAGGTGLPALCPPRGKAPGVAGPTASLQGKQVERRPCIATWAPRKVAGEWPQVGGP